VFVCRSGRFLRSFVRSFDLGPVGHCRRNGSAVRGACTVWAGNARGIPRPLFKVPHGSRGGVHGQYSRVLTVRGSPTVLAGTALTGHSRGTQGVLTGTYPCGVAPQCSPVPHSKGRLLAGVEPRLCRAYEDGEARQPRTHGVLKGYSRGTHGVLKGHSKGHSRGTQGHTKTARSACPRTRSAYVSHICRCSTHTRACAPACAQPL
jgi:hypothetical protein